MAGGEPATPVPAAGRVIAIGDIHGCAAALAALVEAIQPGPEDVLVPLGDYIDRGPDSRGVIDQLIRLGERCRLVPLLGNHEEMLLAAREQASEARFWLKFGGKETLESYGPGADARSLPAEHLAFIRSCRDYYETEQALLVHAYYLPWLPLDRQPWDTLRWVSLREVSPQPHVSGKVAIVGHTPQKTGEVLDLGFLKGIDTYCHGGGWLTALDVRSGKVWQADREGRLRGAGTASE